MLKLAPSILSADFANMGRDIQILNNTDAQYIHIDVMDGVFVPPMSISAQMVSAIRKYTNKTFDVHLMVKNPDHHIESFIKAGADLITVHVEACTHLHRTIQAIKSFGIKSGVALNPATSFSTLEYVLEDVDMVLLMSVNPGFGGQPYIESVTPKIRALKWLIDERGLQTDIEVDGGICLKNAKTVIEAGANVLVAGSSIFNGDIAENVHEFMKIFKEVSE